MANYKDPKVTSTQGKSSTGSSTGRWIAIAAAVIVVLLILVWLLGWFDTTDVGTVDTIEPAGTEEVVTDDEVETPATEGDAAVAD